MERAMAPGGLTSTRQGGVMRVGIRLPRVRVIFWGGLRQHRNYSATWLDREHRSACLCRYPFTLLANW